MHDIDAPVRAFLRIPGDWSHPEELKQSLPDDYTIRGDRLILPDGAEAEISILPADIQFPGIFSASCRQEARRSEMARVRNYKVNVCLCLNGGSMSHAVSALQAGAAIVRAGGAGVFVDNSAMSHGGQHWLEMADDGGPDAVSFAFVNLVSGRKRLRTMGMHLLGFPDLLLFRDEPEPYAEFVIDVIRYLCSELKPMESGHLLLDAEGSCFQVTSVPDLDAEPGRPYHNPFGRLRLDRVADPSLCN